MKIHYSKDVVAVVDYTLPSDQPRFFIFNLKEGDLDIYPVAHATGSGGRDAVAFSNLSGSNRSSLGFMRTGSEYFGKFGHALKLVGLSPSNSEVAARTVVLHSAEYSSQDFYKQNGFWGRSFACLAVEQEKVDPIIKSLGTGTLILAYHDKLWDQISLTPEIQEIAGQSIPEATPWEVEENTKGDPAPHKIGDKPSAFYKRKYGSQ